MLTPDPEQRPSATELLQHPWLAAAAPTTAISTSIMHQLQLFAGLSRARRVMLGVAARNINGSEASRLLKAFLAVDRDFNGTVEFHELAVAAKQVRRCKQHVLCPSWGVSPASGWLKLLMSRWLQLCSVFIIIFAKAAVSTCYA